MSGNLLILVIITLILILYIFREIRKNVDANFKLNGSEHVVIDYGYTYKDEGYIANVGDKTPNVEVQNNIN